MKTVVLFYKGKLVILGGRKGKFGGCNEPRVSLPPYLYLVSFARPLLKDRFLLSFSLTCRMGRNKIEFVKHFNHSII